MADSSSYWSDWASNITQQATQSKSAPTPTAENTDIETYNDRNIPMWKRVGLEKPPTPEQTAPASQQPVIPIQTAQGAPQTQAQLPTQASNSGVVGASPYANQALTGGSGMPIGGLPTQSPMANYSSPQQVQPQQMQLPSISGPQQHPFAQNPQLLQMLQQRLAQRPAALRGYGLFG